MPATAHVPASAAPELAALLSAIILGEPREAPEGFLVPLLSKARLTVEAELLEEGIEHGTTAVEEMARGASVNTIVVKHHGKLPLLIVDGEEILGAKQNRIFNASFLVSPGLEVELPVSCVEAGRWNVTSERFTAAVRTLNARARGDKLRRVLTSLDKGEGYDADQGAVWDGVADYSKRIDAKPSATAAYADAVGAREERIERDLVAHEPLPGQIGLALVAGGRVQAIDLFGSPSLYARAWRKCTRGMLADVFSAGEKAKGDPRVAVRRALAAMGKEKLVRSPSPGSGETLHHQSKARAASMVVWNGAVYHLAVAA